MYKLLSIYLLIIMALPANASVWKNYNSWNNSYEENFSDWVKNSFNEDIFTKGKYAGIPTDCADSVYAARAIFAFENHLPFVIKDFTTGGRHFISNKMNRFNRYSNPLTRFKKFVSYVSDIVGTKSLPGDTYPVEINRFWVKAGGVWSRPRKTTQTFFFGKTNAQTLPGHATLIKKVSETGIVYFIESTVPRAVRKLHITSDFSFAPKNTLSGIRYWKQPSYYSLATSQIPGFSLEQYSMGRAGSSSWERKMIKKYPKEGKRHKKLSLGSWKYDITTRLELRKESREEKIKRLVINFCSDIERRIEIVNDALQKRSQLNRCMNADEFDNYSSPSRDKKTLNKLKNLLTVVTKSKSKSRRNIYKLKNYLSSCKALQISKVKTLSVLDAAISLATGNMSSDPNVDLNARWGIHKAKSNCKQYY